MMKLNDVGVALLLLGLGSLCLAGIFFAGVGLPVGWAAGIESQGFDALAHQIFGNGERPVNLDHLKLEKLPGITK